MNNKFNYLNISNNVSYSYIIIVTKFQIHSIIIFQVIKKCLMPTSIILIDDISLRTDKAILG